MGDRALIVFRDDHGYSPAVYVHWLGSDIPHLLPAAAKALRKDDACYSAARFCGFLHERDAGSNMGLGLIAGPPSEAQRWSNDDWCKRYSHGDAGVFVVDVRTGEATNYSSDGPETFQLGTLRC